MNVVEELLAQRDAVLFGRWVKRSPFAEEEACLVERGTRELCDCGCGYSRFISLSNVAEDCVRASVNTLHGVYSSFLWNDLPAPRGAKSKDQVIEVLDEAIRMAKEAGL